MLSPLHSALQVGIQPPQYCPSPSSDEYQKCFTCSYSFGYRAWVCSHLSVLDQASPGKKHLSMI